MKGQLSQDTPVGAPASMVWSAYRGLELGRLINQLLGDVLGKTEVVEGDGGVGTIIKLTFPHGMPGFGYMKEKFITMNDEKRIKETEAIEGGLKDVGFDAIHVRLEIIEKDSESSIIRSTMEFELDDAKSELASLVSTKKLEIIAEVIGKYLTEQKPNA